MSLSVVQETWAIGEKNSITINSKANIMELANLVCMEGAVALESSNHL